jgi:hypothetical protein
VRIANAGGVEVVYGVGRGKFVLAVNQELKNRRGRLASGGEVWRAVSVV